jgi:hypothetical protein
MFLTGKSTGWEGYRLDSIPGAALFVENVPTFLFSGSILNTMFSGMPLPLD